MSRSLPVGRTLLQLALALTVLWSCRSDDDTTQPAGPTRDAGNVEAATTPDAAVGPTTAALASYVVPVSETMAGIAIDESTGRFFVDSAESGKIFTGVAGADAETTLDLFADLGAAGVPRGGALALSPDGTRLVLVSALGLSPHIDVVDVASKTRTKTIGLTGGVFLQDAVVGRDGKTVYVTDALENVIHTIDLTTDVASSFPLSSDFPHISDPSQGFLNASGVSISSDGKYLLVVHLIDKHIFRVSLDAATLGKAQRVSTDPYNVSGNGLWVDPQGEAIEVGGDELRVFRFQMNDDFTKGELRAKYEGAVLEQGLTYAVAHGDRVLVLNGDGAGRTGAPGGGLDAGVGGDGGFPPLDGGTFPPSTTDAGPRKLPIKVLQLPK